MPERKIVYTVDVNNSKLSSSAKKSISELSKIGDFVKRDLGKIELSAKLKIDRQGAINEAKDYKKQLESLLQNIKAGKIDVDYKQLQFLNRELEKTSGIIAKYNTGGGLMTFGKSIMSQMMNIKAAYDLASNGIRHAISVVSQWISMGAAQLKTNLIIENALSKIGMRYKDIREEVQKIAKENALQEGDVQNIVNYGLALGISKDKLLDFTRASIDYAAQSGKGIEMSMRTVGTLAKAGGDKFTEFAENVRGAGKASAEADGGIKNMERGFNDLGESIGILMVNQMSPFTKMVTDMLDTLTEKVNSFNAYMNKATKERLEFEAKSLRETLSRYKDAPFQGLLAKSTHESQIIRLKSIEDQLKKINDQEKARGKNAGIVTGEYNKQNSILQERDKWTHGSSAEANARLYNREGFNPATAIRVPLHSPGEVAPGISISSADVKNIFTAIQQATSVISSIATVFEKTGVLTEEQGQTLNTAADLLGKGVGAASKFIAGDFTGAVIDGIGFIVEGAAALWDATFGAEQKARKEAEEAETQRRKDLLEQVEAQKEAARMQKEAAEKQKQAAEEQRRAVLSRASETFQQVRDRIIDLAPEEYLAGTNPNLDAAGLANLMIRLGSGNATIGEYDSETARERARRNAGLAPAFSRDIALNRLSSVMAQLAWTADPEMISALEAQAAYFTEVLEANGDITSELESQKKLMQDMQNITLTDIERRVQSGALDVGNIDAMQRIQYALQTSGLDQGGYIDALNRLNIQGANDYRTSKSANIGSVNIEMYEANSDMFEDAIIERLGAIFGRV